jgi:hypothetical protein
MDALLHNQWYVASQPSPNGCRMQLDAVEKHASPRCLLLAAHLPCRFSTQEHAVLLPLCKWCLQKSRQWCGKLAAISGPSSGTARSGVKVPLPSTSTTWNSLSCEMIDCPARNAHLGQRRASLEESTSRWREEMN